MSMKSLREWASALLEAGVIVLILYFVCWPVNIDGVSMEKTFQTGDKAFISKVLVLLNKLNYEDIVVCSIIKPDGLKEKVIKRVIGLPGDSIVIKDGQVIRNGEILYEDYIQGTTFGNIDLEVPKDSIFVLGDNRERSLDSRDLGPIALKKVNGKAFVRFFPFNKINAF